MRKTIFIAVLTLFIFSAFPASAMPGVKAIFIVNETSYTVDGQVKQADAKAFIENSRTYVPIRYLALSLGVSEKDIIWKNPEVILKLESTELKLSVGRNILYKNGQQTGMDVTVLNRNGRTYLPARWVAEAFGYEVKWQPPRVLIGHNMQEEGIQNAPFPVQLIKLEMQVGSKKAIGTKPDGTKVEIMLDEAPFLALHSKEDIAKFIRQGGYQEYNGGIYKKYPPEAITEVKYGAMYLPFASVAKAFGVPESGNIKWDGKKMTVIKRPDWYGTYTLGSKETVWTDGNKDRKRKMDGPLYAKNKTIILPYNELSALMFAGFNPEKELSFMDALDDFEHSSEGVMSGKPSLAVLMIKK